MRSGVAGPGSPAALRAGNRARVVALLREHGEMTQAAVARAAGLSPATVSSIIRELRETGTVDAVDTSAGRAGADQRGDDRSARGRRGVGRRGVGRRGLSLALRPAAGYAVGIDFGHRHLRVLVADLAHTVVAEASRPLPGNHTAAEGIAAAVYMVRAALRQAGTDTAAVVGVAMGLPGPIDASTGIVTSATILPGWVGVAVAERMQAELDLPVQVDNDANLGALAELVWGAGQGCADLLYLKVATGVGAGLVLRGRLYRGAFGTAGEIGHTTIDENGPVCRCGNRGCLEMYAGAGALAELLHQSGPTLDPSELVELADSGDLACRRVIADAGRVLGVAVANVCNVICPERVVVGGALATAGDLLLEPMRASLRRVAVGPVNRRTNVLAGVLGQRTQVLGAVALVLRDSDTFRLAGAAAAAGAIGVSAATAAVVAP
jgi:predicted NBD/HSP70 family sugar kinase/DNA-binding transcriptional ArsR family regulator